MGPYIRMATAKIEEICKRILANQAIHDPEDLRVGVVPYRDYPGQDFQEWTVKDPLRFTSDMASVKTYLSQLSARGGGDGPEAVATALYDASEKMAWNPNAAQAIVVITDAPPHGLPGMAGDGIKDGDPHPKFDGKLTPFKIRDYFTKGDGKGIHILVVQCEPTLTNSYPLGLSYYKGLSKVTNGRAIPLGTAEALADSIVAFSVETLTLRAIVSKLGGSAISDPSHTNAKFHTLFRAVTGVNPSEAEVQQKLMNLYEESPDDMEDQVNLLTTTKTPQEAISALRVHLKGEECDSCSTNVSHSLSPEGLHNMDLFMKASASGPVTGYKEDRGSRVVGDLAKQTITIKKAPLSDGQIKRLAHMYTTRFDTSVTA